MKTPFQRYLLLLLLVLLALGTLVSPSASASAALPHTAVLSVLEIQLHTRRLNEPSAQSVAPAGPSARGGALILVGLPSSFL